jgi:RNA polymerase sigma-70 factor (ECF subfamily)
MQNLHEILDELGPKLYVMLARLTLNEHTAEDLLQDLFVKLGKSDQYMRAENPHAYIYRAAINLAFDWRRSSQHKAPMERFRNEPADETPSPLVELVHAEEIKEVLEVVGKLSEPFREILVRRYIQQESYEDIARELNKTPYQVRTLCSKALNHARISLESKERFTSGRKLEYE